jgi:hypothetical protein
MGTTAKRTARTLDLQERKRKALELRLAGHSYQAIADTLGCSVSTSHGLVSEALAAVPRQASEELRAQEIEKLRELYRVMWTKAETGSERAAAVCVKVAERLARLEGLDAPSRTEITGGSGGPIELLTTAGERVDRRLDRLNAAGASVGNVGGDRSDGDGSSSA